MTLNQAQQAYDRQLSPDYWEVDEEVIDIEFCPDCKTTYCCCDEIFEARKERMRGI